MQLNLVRGVLHISGEISVKTVTATLCRQFEQHIRQPETQTLDFGDVSRADSACLSLLLMAQRSRSGSLNVLNLPAAVQDLAQLYDLPLDFICQTSHTETRKTP